MLYGGQARYVVKASDEELAQLAERLPALPWPLEALFFVAAGLVWILPLKPLLRWMETGKWRA